MKTAERMETNKKASPQDRARRCSEAIAKVLEEHRCVIRPYFLEPESVGSSGNKLLIETRYGILPLEEDT